MIYNHLDNNDIEFFTQLLGAKYVLTDKAKIEPHIEEPRKIYTGQSPCVLRPANTEQVSKIMTYANKRLLAIIPQGGNTGLVGAQVPKLGGEIILSLSRLSADIKVSKQTQSLTCGVGNTLAQVQLAALNSGLFFPLSLASEGSCQIGGNISSNAGGTGVLKYGNMRDLVLGLEVVMADGQIWNGLKNLRKDNTGYDLKHLFIGSEGTLGIVTQACLKLYAKPQHTAIAFCGIQNPQDAVNLLSLAQKNSDNQVTAFEIIPQIGIDFVMKHGQDMRFPLQSQAPWYILLELASQDEVMMNILEKAVEAELVSDAVVAQNETQAKDFWRLRHVLSEVQRLEGGSIKHDISVAVADIPEFLAKAEKIVKSVVPDARPVPFGHIGDGNLHYNISQPVDMDKQKFLNHWYDVADKVHDLVLSMNGSVSAEHGIGQMKFNDMRKIKSDIELTMMRQIKTQFDPKNILNPMKTIPLD
ncbi:MAG: FAD-binding oxidoreductase [Alphaproteobacteria bacterium]|nr:FAD-binding oxidoreductase [Alphaproteobacteria bacterium]